ncbi:PREDICTED: heterogeneous nuclear ribonucleoprotein F-like [Propithecus coquereli]|uniref:heterogeneous nuclear ribonucleoprotein F-like n=1 Tax=Propithecus coquereli TaxID=379532 RepID=UPI00063ED9EF|nr:PREDICTED: heterogeneous nuclear ribonucleoprotein F-like [Propithecus coquereli]
MLGPGGRRAFVVKLRGLPWSCSVTDVQNFLSDCVIRGGPAGVHFVFTAQGRQSGRAFVELESEEDVRMALRKHRESMGQRYVEVFKSCRMEMDWVFQYSGPCGANGRVVRLRGLPFGCSKEDIVQFFSGLEIVRNGVTLPVDPMGRITGHAFVQFASREVFMSSEEEARAHSDPALKSPSAHTSGPGTRPAPATTCATVSQQRSLEGMRPGASGAGRGGHEQRRDLGGSHGSSSGPSGRGRGGFPSGTRGGFPSGFPSGKRGGFPSGTRGGFPSGTRGGFPSSFPSGTGTRGGFPSGTRGGFPSGTRGGFPSSFPSGTRGGFPSGTGTRGGFPSGTRGGFPSGGARELAEQSTARPRVHMSGLPSNATENDIYTFFYPLKPLRVDIEIGQDGRATGRAHVDFATREDAVAATSKGRASVQPRFVKLLLDLKTGASDRASSSLQTPGTGPSAAQAADSGPESQPPSG